MSRFRVFALPLTLGPAVAVALSSPAPATAGAWRHDVDRSAFRQLAASPELTPVLPLFRLGDELRSSGSAVLIAPDWILTAAHNVDRVERRSAMRLLVGKDTIRLTQFVLHPGYRPASIGVDLALVRLGRRVPDVIPATLYRGLAEREGRVLISGYGYALPGNTLAGNQTLPGTAHAGYNVVDSVTATHLLIDFDGPQTPEFNRLGSAIPDSLEYMPSGGDSGGGVFVNVDGRMHLAAINGTVEVDLQRVMEHGWYGALIRLNRVSTSARWIDSIVAAKGH